MIGRILNAKFIPSNIDAGLLILRVCTFGSLFLKHGTEKLFTFNQMATHFPNLFGIGATTGLAFAMVSDGICTVLIMIGLATRWAALIIFINVFVAWSVIHQFMFFGHQADHGEIIVLYISALLAIMVAGPGRFSVDAHIKD